MSAELIRCLQQNMEMHKRVYGYRPDTLAVDPKHVDDAVRAWAQREGIEIVTPT